MTRLLFIIWLTACLGACVSFPSINDDLARHIIYIDKEGNYVPLDELEKHHANAMARADSRIRQGEYMSQDPLLEKHIENIIAGITEFSKKCETNKLLIYIHGGLNTTNISTTKAKEIYKNIKNGGCENGYYPMFINWRSGPLTTYGDHLVRIRQGEKEPWAVTSSPIYLAHDILTSIVGAPKAWWVQGIHSLETSIRDDSSLATHKQDFIYVEKDQGTFNSSKQIQTWLLSPIKLLTTPLTYQVPKPAWDVMLRRTHTLFRRPSEFHDFAEYLPNSVQGTGALSVFLRSLQDKIAENKNENGVYPFAETEHKLEISLVGHSMGSIVANRMIADHPKLPYKRIIYMASADSLRNFMATTIPYVAEHPETTFYSLSLHPKNDDREITAGGVLPAGSLLAYLDNSFTRPTTLLDRRAGRWDNLSQVIHMLPICENPNKENIAIQNCTKRTDKESNNLVMDRIHFKVFGMATGGPQKHGDFNAYRFWEEEFLWGKSE